MQKTPRLHLHVLLDRSGSMASMRDAVLAGFAQLLVDQQAIGGPEPRITLVQFDNEDPAEVVLDAIRLHEARPLDAETFVPRGATPLLDATASLVERASRRVADRRRKGKRDESIVVVTITDGCENASTRHSLKDVIRLVDAKKAEGWTFAYLGATLDAYADASSLGYDPRSVQRFAPTPAGAVAAFAAVGGAIGRRRQKLATGAAFDTDDLFEGVKDAEATA
jgi:uncharacterized protein YegL